MERVGNYGASVVMAALVPGDKADFLSTYGGELEWITYYKAKIHKGFLPQ